MSRILPNDALQRLTPRGVIRKAKGVPASTPIEFVREVGDNEYPTLYFFRKGQQGIIAPADDSIRPILADCEQADWTVELPPNLIDWLGEYDREITHIQNIQEVLTSDTAEPDGKVSVQPLIKTTWAQGSPYNDRLLFDGKKCLVGCNAISLGQILYYWGVIGKDGKKYHRGCIGTDAYTTTTNKYKVGALPPITRFDYDHLTLKAPSSAASIKAVSELLLYCSHAIRSNFAINATGASPTTAMNALRTHFRMGSPVMIFASSGEARFALSVYNELVQKRPVIINGYHANGGHSFLCDGYNAANDTYHFNFGWGGNYNGYYAMSAINPNSKTYNSNKNATIGIEPTYMLGDVNGDGKIDISDVTTVAQAVLNDRNKEQADVNSDGAVTIEDATAISNHILERKKL